MVLFQDADETFKYELVEDDSPIPDPRFLSKAALDMCKNKPINWAYNACLPNKKDKGKNK